MGRVRRRYVAADGAGYNNTEAQGIGEELENMTQEGVSVTPPALVQRAEPEENILHPHFTWNDREAAEKCRLQEARHIVNHLIVVTESGGEERYRKSHFSVNVTNNVVEEETDSSGREYVSVFVVEKEEELRSQVHQRAWAELKAWAERWESFDFKDLRPAIHVVLKNMK